LGGLEKGIFLGENIRILIVESGDFVVGLVKNYRNSEFSLIDLVN
jgi:hypothetical protein